MHTKPRQVSDLVLRNCPSKNYSPSLAFSVIHPSSCSRHPSPTGHFHSLYDLIVMRNRMARKTENQAFQLSVPYARDFHKGDKPMSRTIKALASEITSKSGVSTSIMIENSSYKEHTLPKVETPCQPTQSSYWERPTPF